MKKETFRKPEKKKSRRPQKGKIGLPREDSDEKGGEFRLKKNCRIYHGRERRVKGRKDPTYKTEREGDKTLSSREKSCTCRGETTTEEILSFSAEGRIRDVFADGKVPKKGKGGDEGPSYKKLWKRGGAADLTRDIRREERGRNPPLE